MVPNVAAHPSTASVPITILLYDGPLLCGFNVGIKGLIYVDTDKMLYMHVLLLTPGSITVVEHLDKVD